MSTAATEQPWEWHPDGPEAHAMLEQIQAEECPRRILHGTGPRNCQACSWTDESGHDGHTDPYCASHCVPGVKHSQCGCARSHARSQA